MIFTNRNGLRWHHAPKEYGPPKALSNRWRRWSEIDVFARIFEGLAAQATDKTTIMMNATSLKAHRAQLCCWLVSRKSLRRKGISACISGRKVRKHRRKIRQATQPHQDHGRTTEGLAKGCDPIQPMPDGIPLRHRSRCYRHIQVMRPEPSKFACAIAGRQFGPSVIRPDMTALLCGSLQTHFGTPMPSGGDYIINALLLYRPLHDPHAV